MQLGLQVVCAWRWQGGSGATTNSHGPQATPRLVNALLVDLTYAFM